MNTPDHKPAHPSLNVGKPQTPPSPQVQPPLIVALPDWQGRVSPVFDVAGHILIAHHATGVHALSRHDLNPNQTPPERASQLTRWHVSVLLCGAISTNLRDALELAGIVVIPHLCGSTYEVLQAFLDHHLSDEQFSMPGCSTETCHCPKRRWPPPPRT